MNLKQLKAAISENQTRHGVSLSDDVVLRIGASRKLCPVQQVYVKNFGDGKISLVFEAAEPSFLNGYSIM